jgi:SAM-dependent methyltransferase
VTSREQGFQYVHGLLRREMASLGATRVLDLGCGTGASLQAVVRGSDVAAFGVTNSPVHASMSRERLGERATIAEGDFCTEVLPRGVDLAFAIESFVHAADPKAFFRNVASSLRPGGRLALCDDFLVSSNQPRQPGQPGCLREFQNGWHASSLLNPERVDAVAAACGLELVDDRDFTSFLELDRLRDRILGAVVALGRPVFRTSKRWLSLSGGNALRQCLKQGHVRYRYRVWEKAAPAEGFQR